MCEKIYSTMLDLFVDIKSPTDPDFEDTSFQGEKLLVCRSFVGLLYLLKYRYFIHSDYQSSRILHRMKTHQFLDRITLFFSKLTFDV